MRPLLLAAADVAHLEYRALLAVDALLRRQAAKVRFADSAAGNAQADARYVDLGSERGILAGGAPASGKEFRGLDRSRLAEALQRRLQGLQRGRAPKDAGLSEEWTLIHATSALRAVTQPGRCEGAAGPPRARIHGRRAGELPH